MAVASKGKGIAVDDMKVQPKQTKTKKKKPINDKMSNREWARTRLIVKS